ncbi:MAG TPA: FAD-dependent oxidoreductase, partial [Ilumatobacteraceae bacterium]|nr:FAD-dependent oxidoreductase [Ilumatobacteraceae bacterium]
MVALVQRLTPVPTSARVVVVGGGIVGCSTAYHLARLGWTDTVLIERYQLTAGSTFHAAGLVGQLRTSANITQLLGNSVELYRTLEAETGQATGWKMNGGLRLACNQERWTEVKRQATTAKSFGLEMHLLSPTEAQQLWPLMQVDDLVGAAFLPTDGQANPSDITMALAKGARMAGATICERTEVLSIEVDDGVIRAVVTDQGRIECEKVVLCCGQWTRELAATVGVNVPLVSVEHQYIITEPFTPEVPRNLPTLRDPDRLTYYKEEVGGLVMGGYEPNPIPWAVSGFPKPFEFQLLGSNWDHFAPTMELAIGRVPQLAETGIRQLINGPESFTPDGNFILGEAPELPNLFVGAGFNAFGIAAGGGAGQALAEWVHDGAPPYDLWVVDLRRFGRPHTDTDWVRTRTLEAYAKHYTMAWPFEEHHSGRPARTSPLYDRLTAAGAVFGEKLGWERPNWFYSAALGEVPRDELTCGRQNWFDAVGREHRACREAAVLIDQTSFAKYALKGRDAQAVLDRLCANNVHKGIGALTYTQMLDDRGGIQTDLTVGHVGRDEFYIVTGTGFATHDFDWIRRNIPNGAHAELFDVTSAWAVLSLMGPRSREILQQVTTADLSDESFPFSTVQTIGIAGCPARALRVSYTGELGWELHLPIEYVARVYDTLMAAGAQQGLVNAGYRAIESCRLEKGYRAWGSDIGPDHTPIEAGLAWAVKRDADFIGREAIEAQRREGVRKRLTTFTVAPEVILLGRETIYRDGERVGWLTSGGFGYTVDRSIGYGYVRNPSGVTADWVRAGTYELEVAGERHPA